MTLLEFKVWLDGFCEALPADGAPTAAQFAKIREKLATVTGGGLPGYLPAPAPSTVPPFPDPLWPTVVFCSNSMDVQRRFS